MRQLWPYPVSSNNDVAIYEQVDYQQGISDAEYYGYFRAVYDFALAPLIEAKSRILDFGAGSCHYQKFLEDLGYQHVYSLEPNRHLVEKARARFGLRTVVTSLDELANEQFDLILANQVFEHLFDPIALINGCLRASLKPGGFLVFTVPSFGSWNRVLLGRRWVGYSADEHIWFFTEASVKALFAQSDAFRLRQVVVKSSVNTRHDAFRPRSFAKRAYYRTIMRIFEGLGRGDQLMVTLQRPAV